MKDATTVSWSGTRRDFGQLALGGLAAAVAGSQKLLAIDSTIDGVRVGAISYCFRSIPRPASGDYMDTIIDAFKQTSLGLCELESVRVEPEPGIAGGGRVPAAITPEYTRRREELRQWRLTVPLDRFEEIKGKFDRAGIELAQSRAGRRRDRSRLGAELQESLLDVAAIQGQSGHWTLRRG